ncbi:putative 7,8-dihydro-8-oxoguanine triphosphatase [Penaeus vannamei]|uniref:Oxidized purine nucleoside triphosphate hydrolase n=1 Tax=Penaeus vannamei TaxID=6689 RepID=A0A3R7N2Q9_PENVA|nr:putative 7,8-dihydro-8-oxoguanine triphosphatase [Penaeus vannamei]
MFIREGEKILLGYKKRGFGQGRWNGFGGKVEPGETPEQAAIRETKEEAGVDLSVGAVEKVGELEFTFEGEDILMHVMVYASGSYQGTPAESEVARHRTPGMLRLCDLLHTCKIKA